MKSAFKILGFASLTVAAYMANASAQTYPSVTLRMGHTVPKTAPVAQSDDLFAQDVARQARALDAHLEPGGVEPALLDRLLSERHQRHDGYSGRIAGTVSTTPGSNRRGSSIPLASAMRLHCTGRR